MSDGTFDNISRGYHKLVDAAEQELTTLGQEWHDYWHPADKKTADKPVAAASAADKAKEKPVGAPEAAASVPAAAKNAGDLPAPDKNGVLTVSADSPNFQKAIEQPNVTKLVIDQPGHVNFQVGLTTDAQNKPIFVGQIYEQQGGKIDKTFALPGNVDYVTVNQHNKSADGKRDEVTPINEVAGQGRLAAFKQALNLDQYYPGTFELKPVPLVPHQFPILPTAGTNDAFNLVRKAGRMNDDLLDLGNASIRHDLGVPENSKDPWFNLTLAKIDMLAAGKNLAVCPSLPKEQQDGTSNDAISYLKDATQQYQKAALVAQSHLPDNVKKAHDPLHGQDPRNWNEIPRTQTGAFDWSNPQADITYYGSALDVATYEGRQAQAAERNANSGSRTVCNEDLDKLLK